MLLSSKQKKILKAVRVTLLALVILAVTGIVLALVFRESILHAVLGKVQRKLQASYQTSFTYKEAGFNGLSKVFITDIRLQPEGKDSLLVLDKAEVDIRLWSLLKGNVRLSSLVIGTGTLNLVKDTSGYNFSSFLKKSPGSKSAESGEKKKPNYARTAYRLMRDILDQVPDDLSIEHFSLAITDMGRAFSMGLKSTTLKNESLDASIVVMDSNQNQEWAASGLFDPDNMQTDVSLYNKKKGSMFLPYVKRKFGLTSGIDTLHLQVDKMDFDDELVLEGQAYMRNFLLNHKRLSDRDVNFDRMGINYRLLLDENTITLDSTSVVTMNRISFNPYISYGTKDSGDIGAIRINTPEWQSQDFFNSLPAGIFSNMEGIETKGTISYHLDFYVDFANPDALLFDSDLRRKDFRIVKYGKANLAKLNASFVYTPIEYGRPGRPITVGPENPDFIPLDQIPDNLKNCVLINEDPSFFYHRGFIEEAFRQSIATNIRTRRFARGGSTISMQLVKNVFLSRQKTVSRKMEEALIVWLIESNRICTKERMFEVYLNIIEWAPNVYGIGEASRFYFDKIPMQLNLRECMFLAKLIPSPKAFSYRFNKKGELKDYFGPAFKFMGNRMVTRGWLQPEDTVGLEPRIELRGPARNYIVVTDSTVTEPSLDGENLDIFELFDKKKETP